MCLVVVGGKKIAWKSRQFLCFAKTQQRLKCKEKKMFHAKALHSEVVIIKLCKYTGAVKNKSKNTKGKQVPASLTCLSNCFKGGTSFFVFLTQTRETL